MIVIFFGFESFLKYWKIPWSDKCESFLPSIFDAILGLVATAILDMFLYSNKSKLWYLNTEKTLKIPGIQPKYNALTPIWNILGTSWSVICGQKIHSHIFISDDVIHQRKFLTLCLSETTEVALFIPHLVWSRDVII